jgi:thymidylate kinase
VGKVDLNWIKELNKFNKNIPDITLILKINLDELLKRKKIMVKGFDEFEVKEHIKKQVEVYNNLPKDLIKEFNVEYVDAEEDALETAKKCAGKIQKIIDSKLK